MCMENSMNSRTCASCMVVDVLYGQILSDPVPKINPLLVVV